MKVKCLECGYEAHNLKKHFSDGLEPCCSYSLSEYKKLHPKSRVTSKIFDDKLALIRKSSSSNSLTLCEYDPKKIFGIDMGEDFKATGFVERTQWVPDIDPNYIFPAEATKIVLLGLSTNRPTMVHGPTGTGKSTLVEQICARINYPCMRISHHNDMYSSNILGQKKVINGQTLYEYGPLPFAMRQPMLLILDEWDALNPEIGFAYQPVLERKNGGSSLGSVVLTDNDNERIMAHSLFRIVATSNTTGLGDDKGHYQGTQLQNLAFINRFLLRVKLDYLDEEHETKILQKVLPSLDVSEAVALVKVARLVRERYEAGEINVPYSVRDLINWADIYITIGDPQKAMTYTCTSVLPFSDSKAIEEIVQRVFGGV